jgi:hypothetical protein
MVTHLPTRSHILVSADNKPSHKRVIRLGSSAGSFPTSSASCVAVFLSQEEATAFYEGFSNSSKPSHEVRRPCRQPCSSASVRAISCRRLSSGNAAPGQPIHLVLYCPSGSPSSAATSPPEDLVTRSSSTVTGKRLETFMRVLAIGVPGCEMFFLPVNS